MSKTLKRIMMTAAVVIAVNAVYAVYSPAYAAESDKCSQPRCTGPGQCGSACVCYPNPFCNPTNGCCIVP